MRSKQTAASVWVVCNHLDFCMLPIDIDLVRGGVADTTFLAAALTVHAGVVEHVTSTVLARQHLEYARHLSHVLSSFEEFDGSVPNLNDGVGDCDELCSGG